METTQTLSLPYIMSAQEQKHVTHNEALRMLDGYSFIAVPKRLQENEPPASPFPGSR